MTADFDITRHWTAADYFELETEDRYEVMRGELVMVPAPTSVHQRVITRLGTFIDMFVIENELGECFHTPIDVLLADDVVLQPDFVFVSAARLGEVVHQTSYIKGAPDLVVEVLSPSTARRDRLVKREIYAEAGVRWYLLVDADQHLIEVFELSDRGQYLAVGGAADGDFLELGAFPGLRVDLSKVWPDWT